MPRRRRSGSIVRRREGHWRVRVPVQDPSGRRKEASREVKGTRKDAERALAVLIAEQETGKVAPRDISLALLVNDRYLPFLKTAVVAPTGEPYSLRTRQRYAYALKKHVLPHLGNRKIRGLDLGDLEWLRDRLMASHLTPATVGDCLQVLSAAFTYAVRHGLLPRNPCEHLARPSRRPKRVVPRVDPETARQVLDVARTSRLAPAAALMLGQGLRRSEALGLRWCDVDFDREEITVRLVLTAFVRPGPGLPSEPVWKGPKTRKSERTIPLLSGTAEVLKETRAAQRRVRLRLGTAWAGAENPDEDLVVAMTDGRPWRPDSFSRGWRRFQEDSELASLTPRDLRSAWVSLMYGVGADPKVASDWGGHSEAVARAHYLRSLTAPEEAAKKRLEEVFAPPVPRSPDAPTADRSP